MAKVVLSDAEWMALISKDRELGPCCGGIEALRRTISEIAQDGGEFIDREGILELYNSLEVSHSLDRLPTLQQFIKQVKSA